MSNDGYRVEYRWITDGIYRLDPYTSIPVASHPDYIKYTPPMGDE